MADLDIAPLVKALGRANHDYFVRRKQTSAPWDGLPPIYRHSALAAHLEILLDGPVDVVRQMLEEAWDKGYEQGRELLDKNANPYRKEK